jgi:hypothetical protein
MRTSSNGGMAGARPKGGRGRGKGGKQGGAPPGSRPLNTRQSRLKLIPDDPD